MSLKRPFLDELIFTKVKNGNGTYDDILNLKKEYNITILEIVGSLQRLEDNNIIKRLNNKFKISDNFG